MLQTILLILHIGLAISLIALILLQQGRGATAGAAFGSGASSTVFGAQGSASFLTRTTAVLALIFFSNSFLLAYLSGPVTEPQSIMEQPLKVEQPIVDEADVGATAPQDLPDMPGDLPDMPAGMPGTPADLPDIPAKE